MASRSLGELLLRPSTFTRTPHSTCSRTLTRTPSSWTSRRSISSTPSQSAQPARKDEEEPDFEQPQQQQQPQSSQPQVPHTDPFGSLVSDTVVNQSGSGPFPFSPSRRIYSPSNPFGNAGQRQPSSGDEMQAARANHVFGSEFSNAGPRTRRPPKLNFDSMDMPEGMLNPSLSNKPDQATLLATQQEETFANYPRLNPTYGRTIDLDTNRGRDLVRGIGMLASLTARNRIKNDFAVQKFHERPGLKRKRLNSERWRKRFKVGFTAVTSRVSELTRKGW